MPSVRKLEPEEVRAIENRGKGPRKLIEEQYDELLREYNPGDYGEADLDPEENRVTVRNRLKAAAARRGAACASWPSRSPPRRWPRRWWRGRGPG